MSKKIIETKVTIDVPKFTRPEIIEKLTKENIQDIISSQERAIKELESEIETKKKCLEHYKEFIK